MITKPFSRRYIRFIFKYFDYTNDRPSKIWCIYREAEAFNTQRFYSN